MKSTRIVEVLAGNSVDRSSVLTSVKKDASAHQGTQGSREFVRKPSAVQNAQRMRNTLIVRVDAQILAT